MKFMPIIGAALGLAWTTAAGASDVASYLARMDALRAKGITAMFSSDYHDLTAEIGQATAELKQQRLVATSAGERPAYCPPAGGSLSAAEVMAALQASAPAARARTSVKNALRAGFIRKYPCR